jgi:hypothetical protein
VREGGDPLHIHWLLLSEYPTHRDAANGTDDPSLRGATRRSNPFFLYAPRWIASLRSQ